jgi:hypothetical protein
MDGGCWDGPSSNCIPSSRTMPSKSRPRVACSLFLCTTLLYRRRALVYTFLGQVWGGQLGSRSLIRCPIVVLSVLLYMSQNNSNTRVGFSFVSSPGVISVACCGDSAAGSGSRALRSTPGIINRSWPSEGRHSGQDGSSPTDDTTISRGSGRGSLRSLSHRAMICHTLIIVSRCTLDNHKQWDGCGNALTGTETTIFKSRNVTPQLGAWNKKNARSHEPALKPCNNQTLSELAQHFFMMRDDLIFCIDVFSSRGTRRARVDTNDRFLASITCFLKSPCAWTPANLILNPSGKATEHTLP